MIYDFEWPKTAADYAKLFSMKSFDLQEIYLEIHEINGKDFTTGIKFTFHGEKDPIIYGK